MFRKRNFFLLLACGVITFLIFTFISINVLTNWETLRYNSNLSNNFDEKIWKLYHNLPKVYHNKVEDDVYKNSTKTLFLNNIVMNNNANLTYLWTHINSIINKQRLYPQDEYLAMLIKAMETAKVVNADLDKRGTQLKLLLTLEGGQKVIFKPKWYQINKIIEGPVYSGKDRFGSEIVAFYMSSIMNKPLAPVSVMRELNLNEEILPVASKELLSTMFHYKNLTCIYGKCFYCKKEDPICSNELSMLTGALIFNLNVELKNHRSPWQRTYKLNKKALWEVKENYCNLVKEKLSRNRLYDLIDASIFDFLIQNGDRHHYETFQDKVILLDNGKGLGNPHVHHLDILAPLYQCCLLRKSTWDTLLRLRNGKLKELLYKIPNIHLVTTAEHIDSFEIRLKLVYAIVEYCKTI